MNNDLHSNYSAGSVNWRSALKANNNRTIVVIALFFAIYLVVGLLIDTLIYTNTLTTSAPYYANMDPGQIFFQLLSLQLFPAATLVMLVIAAVSLFLALTFADQLMLLGTEYTEITPQTARTLQEKQLYNIVEELKIAGGLAYMPKVYIIDADYMNAFASGFSERSAMVAITRGLMEKLDRDELQAVMAHEVSHIRHLDIKLTLIASLLANMTLIALDFAVFSRSNNRRENNNQSRGNGLIALLFLLRYLLPLINILLLLYLSRSREFMADAGCVELTRNNEPLARALIKISGDYQQHKDDYQPVPHDSIRREAYIFDPAQAGIKSLASTNDLFSTHPSLEDRLAALGYKRKA
jgi:heat shock protein HtpX